MSSGKERFYGESIFYAVLILTGASFLQIEFQLSVQRGNSASWEINGGLYVVYSVTVLRVVNRNKVSDPLPAAINTLLSYFSSVQFCSGTYLCQSKCSRFSFQSRGWAHFYVYVHKLGCSPTSTGVNTLNRFAANPGDDFFPPAQICTLPGVSVCNLKQSSLLSALCINCRWLSSP